MRFLAVLLIWVFAFLMYQTTKLVVILDRKFKFKLSFPRTIDELQDKQDWCVQTLTAAGALPSDIEIKTYSITQPHPELIFRSDTAKCLIEYLHKGQPRQLDFVAKFSPSQGPLTDRVTYNMQQNHVKEVQFNTAFAPRLRAGLTPRIYFAEFNEGTANMCILMEYMGDYTEFTEFEGCPEQLLPIVIKKYAALHATFWEVKDKEVKGIMAIPRVVADFFESMSWFKWSKAARSVFRQCWERINVPQTIIHGDGRVGNLMFHKQDMEQMVFIDWQGARMSKAAFDLAYFLILSVTSDSRNKCEDELLESYHKELIQEGITDYSLAEIRDDYNYSCIMVLTMLATSGLTAEGSFDRSTDASMTFLLGYKYWYDRVENKVLQLDQWMSTQFNLNPKECKEVIEEILSSYKSYLDKLQTSLYPDAIEADKKFAEIELRISKMRD